MPCVLPVITLKLRSFIPAVDSVPQSQRRAFRSHNLFFALGMMVYFLILAGIIAATGMAWGQIFQEPAAIITLTAIVFALSLSLFGVYDLPSSTSRARSRAKPITRAWNPSPRASWPPFWPPRAAAPFWAGYWPGPSYSRRTSSPWS